MQEVKISENLLLRNEDGEMFIAGVPDEVFVDEDAGGRGMV